jgi:hypothetical protein
MLLDALIVMVQIKFMMQMMEEVSLKIVNYAIQMDI